MSTTLFQLVTGSARLSRAPQFAAWLDRLLGTGNAHAKLLVTDLPNTHAAVDACRLLQGARAAGWITEASFEPTPNHVWLGAGGLQGTAILALRRRGRDELPWHGPREWGRYSPTTWWSWGRGRKLRLRGRGWNRCSCRRRTITRAN
jgi:hypothetical protein